MKSTVAPWKVFLSAVLVAVRLSAMQATAVTPVPMASQSGLSYTENFADVANWTANFASGIGASAFGSVAINATGSIPDGAKTTVSSAAFSTGASGGVQKGTGNLQMLVTGSTNNSAALALDFLMDFTGVNAGNVSFDWAAVANSTGDRSSALRVYSSTNGTTFSQLGADVVVRNNVASNGTFTAALPVGFAASATARLRFYLWNSGATGDTNGSRPKISIDNLNVTAAAAGVVVSIDNTGVPPAGNVVSGTTDVPVFGFRLTPTGSVDFTALALNTTGTATTADLSNFRVVQDADSSGTYNAGDTIASVSSQALAAPINFTFTNQTSLSAARRYLVIADVAAGATVGRTFTASIPGTSAVTTSTGTKTGSAAGTLQTIVGAANDLTLATAAGESATISSLLNDATIPTTTQGAQTWQFTINNPAGNALAGMLTALTLTQGASNQVTNWLTTIQAAELFDGSTALAAGTIAANNIAFTGLSVALDEGASKTLTLRISVKATAGVLTDNTRFQFALTSANTTVSGNGVTTAFINSDPTRNSLSVVATKLAFTTTPASAQVNTNFLVTVKAQDANGNVDHNNTAAVAITLATGTGTLTGGSSLSLVAGSQSWPSLQKSTLGAFTLTAGDTPDNLTDATSASIAATGVPTLTEIILPQYIQGGMGASNTKRVPFAYRVVLTGLVPSAIYRYSNQAVIASDSATFSGAGNVIFAKPDGTFARTTGPSLSTAGNYAEFTTDATGAYTGWFMIESTGNATRFATAGTQLYMTVTLNDGNNGTSAVTYLRTTNFVTVIAFGTSGANTGTAITGNSSGTAGNFVMLYDNLLGTGRPLAATVLEADTIAETTANSYASFYSTQVNEITGAWGNILPNALSNGVRRIEQRSNAAGTLVGANTDANGIWPSGASTVNPAAGDATPIAISATDAPLLLVIPTLAFTGAGITETAVFNAGPNTSTKNVSFAGVPNQHYTLQFSSDLIGWTDVDVPDTGLTGNFTALLTLPGDQTALLNQRLQFRAFIP